jgi:hypothetical protein
MEIVTSKFGLGARLFGQVLNVAQTIAESKGSESSQSQLIHEPLQRRRVDGHFLLQSHCYMYCYRTKLKVRSLNCRKAKS